MLRTVTVVESLQGCILGLEVLLLRWSRDVLLKGLGEIWKGLGLGLGLGLKTGSFGLVSVSGFKISFTSLIESSTTVGAYYVLRASYFEMVIAKQNDKEASAFVVTTVRVCMSGTRLRNTEHSKCTFDCCTCNLVLYCMDALTLGPSVSLSVRVYLSACSLSVCLSAGLCPPYRPCKPRLLSQSSLCVTTSVLYCPMLAVFTTFAVTKLL